MRKYCMGAILLDLAGPSRVLGRLRQPLLCSKESGLGGYVPNVVHTCGAFLRCNSMIMPYEMSDSSSCFATVGLDDLPAATYQRVRPTKGLHGWRMCVTKQGLPSQIFP